MLETLIKLFLAPILLLQGLYVRRVTPRLPEPAGERSGSSGTGPHLRLLILGDSAAAGVGVNSQAEALSGQLVSNLAHDYRVSWKLLAQSGADTSQVLAMVESGTSEPYDVILLSVGVNDVTACRVSARSWCASVVRLLDVLMWKHGARQVLLAPLPPMHAFPALPQPLRWFLGRRAQQFNGELARLTEARFDCLLQHNELPFEQNLSAGDGFHPGARVYALWADNTASAVRRHFVDPVSLGGRVAAMQ